MLKEHPWLVTTTFQGDGITIKYDITKPNRSDAVGKAFKLNAEGIGELVGNDDEIDGKVIAVDDDHKFTAAYMFGGLNLPLGNSATVARGDKVVGALGPGSAKGHVKGAPAIDPAETTTADLASQVVNARKGAGKVLEFDTAHALVAMGA